MLPDTSASSWPSDVVVVADAETAPSMPDQALVCDPGAEVAGIFDGTHEDGATVTRGRQPSGSQNPLEGVIGETELNPDKTGPVDGQDTAAGPIASSAIDCDSAPVAVAAFPAEIEGESIEAGGLDGQSFARAVD